MHWHEYDSDFNWKKNFYQTNWNYAMKEHNFEDFHFVLAWFHPDGWFASTRSLSRYVIFASDWYSAESKINTSVIFMIEYPTRVVLIIAT